MQVLRRMERLLQGTLRAHITGQHSMWHVLSLAHRLRADMSGFVRHLLEYATNLVIEGAWTSLLADIAAVRLLLHPLLDFYLEKQSYFWVCCLLVLIVGDSIEGHLDYPALLLSHPLLLFY